MKRIFSSYYFIFFVAMASTQPFLSLYLSGKGLSSTHIGLLLAAGSVAGILAQPIVGYLNDRARDTRLLLLFSAILSPLVYAGYAVVHSFLPLLLVAVVLAIVQSTSPIADAMAVQEGARGGFNYGQIRLWGALSFALTTMVAGDVYHLFSIGVSFYIYGALSVVIVAITRFLPKSTQGVQHREPIHHGLWNVVRDVRLTSFIVICFFLSTAITINFTFLPLYFKALHYPLGLVGLNFTVAALVEVPLFYVSGHLMKRIGKLPVMLIATACYFVKYVLMALAPGAVTVILLQILDGIAYALYWSAGVQIVADIAPSGRTATAQTLFGAIAGSLSSIVGLSLGGWVMQRFGPLSLYASIAVISLIAFVGFAIFARVQKRTGHGVQLGEEEYIEG